MKISQTLKLGDICTSIYSGGTPKSTVKSYYEGTIPWLNTTEVRFNRIRHTEKNITALGFENSSAKWVPENSIIIAMYGASAGRSAITKIPLTTNQACCNLIVNSSIADYRYVYFYLVNQYKILVSLANGGAQQNLSVGQLSDFEIILPPLAQQKRIADFLSCLDDKIELNQKINDNLETQAKLLFDEWFVKDGGSKTAGAKDEVLGNVISVVKKTFNPEKEPETGLEHYSIPAFDAGKFPVFESSLSIKSNKYIVDKDCFMISKLNPTTKRVWRPYCLTSNAVCSTEFIVFKAKESAYTDFLYSLINCDVFSEHLCNHVTGSTGSRQRTNPDDALKFMFKLPTKATIADFSSIVAPMYDQIRTNAIENNSLRQLRDYLLPLLMSGQISIGG